MAKAPPARHRPPAAPPAPGGPAAPEGERDVAAYLALMTAELAALARASDYDLLAYFLDMARIEAKLQADRNRRS